MITACSVIALSQQHPIFSRPVWSRMAPRLQGGPLPRRHPPTPLRNAMSSPGTCPTRSSISLILNYSSTASARPGLPGVIVAATIGNVLEWFDFLVYGFFAVTIAEVFFPASDPTVSLLITFGTFGLAYVVRPLGAIVVGTYTDRVGRKAGL